METKIIPPNQINEAIVAIKKGELVAFPTETVYGLGADATNEEAVKNVYSAKGRPSDNPLIIHVSNREQINTFVDFIPENGIKLMETFWPGPLTLIFSLKEKTELSQSVTGGLQTAAFRMPNNRLTLELIEQSEKVLVGPSANTSGRPSPTKAEHVVHDLAGKIFGVLDGGDCEVGLESTVLDLSRTNQKPIILRPGAITKTQIEDVIGEVAVDQADLEETSKQIPRAPGMKYTHYAPKTPVGMVDFQKDNWQQALDDYKKKNKRIGVLVNQDKLETLSHYDESFILGKNRNVSEAMRFLYAGLRELDEKDLDVIFVETYEEKDEGKAYMNRLQKASDKKYL